MKVLYGMSSNGQGHINRSRIFIKQLIKDGHEVHILLAGKRPPQYAFEIVPKTLYVPGPTDIYKDNKVDYGTSLHYNFANLNHWLEYRKELVEPISKESYDLFISDLEHNVCYIGKQLNKPVICINRQHAIFHPLSVHAPGRAFDKMGCRLVYAIMQPYYTHSYSIDFTNKIQTLEKDTLFPLIWKPELDKYKIAIEDHITAYLPWYDADKLVNKFSQFPDEIFYVYGFNKKKKVKNVVFKETSRDGFLTDLVSSKGVIGNAGFNICWEVSLLKKFIWSMPLWGQYEQITNAYRLEQLGQAFVSQDFTTEYIAKFLAWIEIEDYIPKNNITVMQPSDLLNHVYNWLENYNREYVPDRRKIRRDIKLSLNRWRMRHEIRKEIKANHFG
ncbi:MAG: hypothetical protein FK733_03535 [Asgard group archaeon]|nr:hypothetical protein [Asgard group archaeon]